MTTVSLGEHSKLTARPSERDRVRKFYLEALGCPATRESDKMDIFRIGTGFFLAVVYDESAPSAGDGLKSIWLELRTDHPEELKQKILEFGIRGIDFWDKEHFYFQAPGGQVFRVVKAVDCAAPLTPRAITDGETVLACVAIAAPPERVFEALTTDEAEQWWGAAETYRIVDWAADLRVGGEWSLGVQLPNGNVLPASGEFLEVDMPRKFVQTRRYDWDHPTLGRTVTTVTFRLDTIPEGTRLTVRHDGFRSSEPAYEHAAGWERLLGWLQSYLEKENK